MTDLRKILKDNMRQYSMIIALVVIMAFFQVLTDGVLLKPMNITNLVLQNSYVFILAIGMLLCIITGYVDLSVGSVVAFVGAVSAVMVVDYNLPFYIVLPVSLLIGVGIGMFHGFFIAYVKIPPFIVTLAGMLIFRGLTMVILKGQTKAPPAPQFQSLAAGFLPGENFKLFGMNGVALIVGVLLSLIVIYLLVRSRAIKSRNGFEVIPLWMEIVKIGLIVAAIGLLMTRLAMYKGIPIVLVLLASLIGIYTFITQRTIAGRHVYARGGNEKAAHLSGVNTDRVMFWVYTNMGLLAAVAGLVVAGRLNAATPKAGNGFELDAIASCYIGGASASGGVGTVVGAIIGALVMGVLNNGMSIMGVSVDWQQAIKGMVLLGAVTFDVYSKQKSRSA